MDKMVILTVLVVYFGAGLAALCLLDGITKRIRARLLTASWEAQHRLETTGNFLGSRSAVAVTIAALWVFWPVAIYAALVSRKGKKKNEQ